MKIIYKLLINFSKRKIIGYTNMSYMFFNFNSLKNISDMSKWSINKDVNIVNMSYVFSYCNQLLSLPDISLSLHYIN